MFQFTLIVLSFIITCVLILAVGSLFFIADFGEVWQNLWSEEMQFSFKLSLFTGGISTISVLIIAVPVGYALSRFQFVGKGLVKTVIDLPIAFPELVLGLCLLMLLGKGPIGNMLTSLGFSFVFTKQGIVAAQFFTALPYAIRIMKSTFDYVDLRMEFVSRSLGYSLFETFLHVSLPLAKNGILATTVITFARCIGAFGTVLILAGGTYMQTEVLSIALYLNISYGNIGMAVTSGVILMGISFVIIYIFEKAEVGSI